MRLLAALTLLLFAVWIASSILLPQAILRPYFAGVLTARNVELSATSIVAANLVPFAGVAGMNLFRVGTRSGGLYVLVIFWAIYGLLLGTNSFVFAGAPVSLSVSVFWERSGFTEATAYTLAYVATTDWTVWTQSGLLGAPKRLAGLPRATFEDACYLLAGLGLLVLAAVRETA